ncbi:MAG: TetR/AcrR family transcriptional regulator [Candidimonas sp.]|nr:MAG: TetR/AcrR family transcriptional regulator [Candidimonas sp.]TAM22650.1 MAG: TetR/AcrR family transcriptional regulator [Candidimonas sp.]TAM74618.1 MAG: TetR/AcrR family transcriptional regulator [Candidimonas sp.]
MTHPTPSAAIPSARERILCCAAELFYQKGINNVGINEVIAKSAIARMTLYHHFASKDALICGVLGERMERRQAELTQIVERTRSAQRKVLAMFDYLSQLATADGFRGCAFINASIELADPDHPAYRIAVSHKQWMAELFEHIASEAHWSQPGIFGEQCLLLWDGAALGMQMHRNNAPLRAARAAATVLIKAAQR